MKKNLLKGRSFWHVKTSQNCYWSRRKILKFRDTAKNFIKLKVGDGNSIHMWFDLWHPNGILYTRFGQMVVYDTGSKVEAKLSSV